MALPPAAEPSAGDETSAEQAAPRSSLELFLTFSAIALQSFGGALAFMERTLVRRKRWLDAREFLGLYAISQVMPGPTGISFCVLLGDRFFGLRGALAAVAGFVLPPALIVVSLAALFERYQHLPWVQGALHGMGAAAVGLIIHTAVRLSRGVRGEHVSILVAALTFVAVALLRLPVSVVMLSLGLASVAWAWRVLGR